MHLGLVETRELHLGGDGVVAALMRRPIVLGRVAARSRCFLDFYALGDHRDALGDQRDSHVYALGDLRDALGDHDGCGYP